MSGKNVFTVADFAHFARTTRDTLIHYDKIGLLSPVSRGKNGYRYYSGAQLATVNLIRTCRELGMSLEDIREIIEHRTPEMMSELLQDYIAHVDKHINEWIAARKLLQTLSETINQAILANEAEITVAAVPSSAIVLGGLNDYSQGRDDYDALLDFYYDCQQKYPNMNLNYSVWGVFSEERIKRGDWKWPDRYYFNDPDGLDRKPAALYVIGYKRGGYGQSDSLYKRLVKYIKENGYEICGPAFEEYPLNEICITEEDNYLMRVMITVKPGSGKKRKTTKKSIKRHA